MERRLDGLSTIPDGPNTLTIQSFGTNNAKQGPASRPRYRWILAIAPLELVFWVCEKLIPTKTNSRANKDNAPSEFDKIITPLFIGQNHQICARSQSGPTYLTPLTYWEKNLVVKDMITPSFMVVKNNLQLLVYLT